MAKTLSERIAWWLPKRIIYFCVIRAWAWATTGKYSDTIVPDITVEKILKRWRKQYV